MKAKTSLGDRMKVICFDLDDTLYKEIDYLKSAYKEIVLFAMSKVNSKKYSIELLYSEMLKTYLSGLNAFEFLNCKLNLNLPMVEYLNVYRNHKPHISLSKETLDTLSFLQNYKWEIGLITDGRIVQQQNKIDALGLRRYVKKEDIIISEEFGYEKPSVENYLYFEKSYPKADIYIYVGDNLNKDFLTPNALGWITICIKDNGLNIHKQNFHVPNKYLPHKIVSSISGITDICNSLII